MDLSIIIPVYNEEANIENNYKKIKDTLNTLKRKWEVIFVNDGSTDRTNELLEKIAKEDPHVRVVSYFPNQGRGKALREGFKKATGNFIVTIDADLSYDPFYIKDIYKILKEENVDMVLASPYMPGGATKNVPKFRLFLSKFGNKLLTLTFPKKIYTSTSILRGYRKEVIESIQPESDGKEIHLEILSKALAMNYNIKEIPAVLTSRKKGKSKFRLKKTVATHLTFVLFEKPILIFGFLGILLLTVGIAISIYIVYLRFSGTLSAGRPLLSLTLMLVLGGIQLLSFGFIAIQMVLIRREIMKLHKENHKLIIDISSKKAKEEKRTKGVLSKKR